MSGLIHQALSDKVLRAAFRVHHAIGCGLLESVYEEAFCVELQDAGLRYDRQKVYPVMHKGRDIGRYIADLVVENTIILELKAVANLIPVHEAQLL
jgi:GxxExxY protein